MGEARRDALRVDFDGSIKLEFHGARVSSDAGLFPYRELDEVFDLTESGSACLSEFRTGNNPGAPGPQYEGAAASIGVQSLGWV